LGVGAFAIENSPSCLLYIYIYIYTGSSLHPVLLRLTGGALGLSLPTWY
jgi:hypothetical protein